MHKMIKSVLEKIEQNGNEAYLVGGFVRDSLLGIKTTDIDICTNALPKDLATIFEDQYKIDNSYGVIKIINDKFNFDITTYRKESKYVGHKPGAIEYINNLLVDINRRDFTINALCMNSKGHIIDLIEGRKDLKHKLIRAVGNAEKRITEDPLRILRAIRFATVLNFTIDEELLLVMQKEVATINTLSLTRIKNELDKIFAHQNVLKGLRLLNNLGVFNLLKINGEQLVVTEDVSGTYSQLELPADFPLSNNEKNNIASIKKVIAYGRIDNNIMYQEGYYACLIGGKILGLSAKSISRIYEKMPLIEKNDLKIEILEICNIIGIEPGKILKMVIDDLIDQILERKLANNRKDISKYLITNREQWLNEKSD